MRLDAIKRRIVEKLSKNKKLEFCVYAVLIAAALVIFAATGGISCGDNGLGHTALHQSGAASGVRTEAEIEAALEEILSNIKDAGNVKVMISMSASGSKAISSLGQSNAIDFSGGESTGLLPKDFKDNGTADNCYRIDGVIVIASGASDIKVKTQLTDAVKTLLGIDASRVGVYTMAP